MQEMKVLLKNKRNVLVADQEIGKTKLRENDSSLVDILVNF